MAYDEDLAERVRELAAGERRFDEKRMFGGLMVRVSPGEIEGSLKRDHLEPVVMAGRETCGWLRVSAEGLGTKRQLQSWVTRGVACAKGLPPK